MYPHANSQTESLQLYLKEKDSKQDHSSRLLRWHPASKKPFIDSATIQLHSVSIWEYVNTTLMYFFFYWE